MTSTNKRMIFVRARFETIDPFFETQLTDECFATNYTDLNDKIIKAINHHINVAKNYNHITPEYAKELAYSTLEFIEYYE